MSLPESVQNAPQTKTRSERQRTGHAAEARPPSRLGDRLGRRRSAQSPGDGCRDVRLRLGISRAASSSGACLRHGLRVGTTTTISDLHEYLALCAVVPRSAESRRWSGLTEPNGARHRPAVDVAPLRLAFSLNVTRRHHEAADSARRAPEIDPNYHLMWREHGVAQIHLGSIPDAVSSFGRPVELAPCISHGLRRLPRGDEHARAASARLSRGLELRTPATAKLTM